MLTKRLSTLALLAATLVLTACGSGDAASPGPSIADAATVAAVVWSEAADGTPVLTFDSPLVVSDATARLLQDGDGATIEDGQVVTLDFVAFSGVDGTLQFSTYESGAPESLVLAQADVTPALWNVLVGSHVGAQIIFATPDASATPTDGVYPCTVLAMTVSSAADVVNRAEGEAVAPVAGLPAVTLAENGAPSIDLVGVEMPTSLVVQPLIVGSGAPVVVG